MVSKRRPAIMTGRLSNPRSLAHPPVPHIQPTKYQDKKAILKISWVSLPTQAR